jgi:ribosomal-protein-alanine N-acetyltransferase
MDDNPVTILETERLLFRPNIMADIDAYCAMEMDADVRRYVGGYPRTREEAEKRFYGSLKPVANRLAMWATVFKPEGQYIGRCGIYPHFNSKGKPIPGEASLGFYIARAYWGRGFATEAGRAFVQLGFDELQLNRIVTMIDTRNNASVHVITKIGFGLKDTEIGEHRSFYHFSLENLGK